MPEAPAAPPPVVTPPPATPPAAPAGPDPYMARILEDMGKALSDGQVIDAPAKAPETPKNVLDGEFVSMGEHARFRKERAEAEKAKTPDPDPAKAQEKKPEAAKEPPKPGDAPAAPAPDKPAEPPAPAPAAPKKIVVEKAKPIEEIVEGVVRRINQEKPAEPTKAEPKKETPASADPDADFISALDEDQKEAVELAQFAAKAMPDKYGNMPKKTVEYLKKVDKYIDDKRKEDADWDPDTDEGFSAFIEENRPTYQSGDRRRLERQQIADEVRADVEKEFKPKIEATERAERSREIKPEIDKSINEYSGHVAQRFVPDDKSPFAGVMKVVTEKGMTDEAWTEAKAIDPIAANVARHHMAKASSLGREYLEMASGVSEQTPYDPKLSPTAPQNQKALTQSQIFSFIDAQEDHFAKNGQQMHVVNGKTFVTRRVYSQMSAQDQVKHWTLGHDDVMDMLAVAAALQANQDLAAEVKRREDEGYVRNGKHGAPKKEPAPAPAPARKEESPKTSLTPAPGAANLPPPVSGPTVFTDEELKRQWSGGVSKWG